MRFSKIFDAKHDSRIVLFLTMLLLFLCLVDLGDIFYWADEGWSLVIGRFILAHGVPKAFDETHALCSQYGVSKDGLWGVQAWLPFYVTAASIKLFGDSVVMLRLPFVLMGVACVPLLAAFAERLGYSRRAGLLACLLLSCNVPFILLLKNVRYYAMAALLGLGLMHVYVGWSNKRSPRASRAWVSMCVFSILLVHTYQPVYFGIILALMVDILLKARRGRDGRKSVGLFVLSQTLTALFFLPWVALVWSGTKTYIERTAQSGIAGHLPLFERLANVGVAALLYFFNLLHYHFPSLVGAALGVLLYRKNKKFRLQIVDERKILLPAGAILGMCVSLPLFRNDNLWSGYLIACIPLALLLAAALFDHLGKLTSNRLMAGVVAVFLLSTALNLPYWPFRSAQVAAVQQTVLQRRLRALSRQVTQTQVETPLIDYVFKELPRSYDGPVETIVNFLRPSSRMGETFFATNDVNTIQFTTGLKAIQEVPFTQPPDWIIRRGNSSWENSLCSNGGLDVNVYVADYLMHNNYEMLELDAPDLYHENEPVLPQHYWATPSHARRVVIFRHRKE